MRYFRLRYLQSTSVFFWCEVMKFRMKVCIATRYFNIFLIEGQWKTSLWNAILNLIKIWHRAGAPRKMCSLFMTKISDRPTFDLIMSSRDLVLQPFCFGALEKFCGHSFNGCLNHIVVVICAVSLYCSRGFRCRHRLCLSLEMVTQRISSLYELILQVDRENFRITNW